ncbi:hypothetical protein BN903_6 [Halorubrum sp. AJ67]|nr:hypothetical protein BN903_6 [Halorubrum sp. AJ67]
MFDEVLGGTVGDTSGTGNALSLPAGVREIPPLVFALFEDGLVVRELDRLALFDELDLEVLHLVFGDVAGTGADGAALFEFALLAVGTGRDRARAATAAADRAVTGFGELRLRNRGRAVFEHFLGDVGRGFPPRSLHGGDEEDEQRRDRRERDRGQAHDPRDRHDRQWAKHTRGYGEVV